MQFIPITPGLEPIPTYREKKVECPEGKYSSSEWIQPWGEKPGLLDTFMLAWMSHGKVELRPDDLWALFMAGFADAVERNPQVFFPMEKKQLEVVQEPPFDPELFFSQIAAKIEKDLPDDPRVKPVTFSTTTPLYEALGRTMLMNTMKHHYEFKCTLMCGLQGIVLLGKKEDWDSLAGKAEMFLFPETPKPEGYDNLWFRDNPPKEVMDYHVRQQWNYYNRKVIKVFQQVGDERFWQGFFKYGRCGSGGGEDIQGHVLDLMPHDELSQQFQVPFKLDEQECTLESGYFATTYREEDNCFVPVIGWRLKA